MKYGAVFLLALGSALPAVAGGWTSGGADSHRIDLTMLSQWIEDGALKSAMLNYLRTLQIADITDTKIKSLFTKLVRNDLLQKDIRASSYRVSASCQDAFNDQVSASTRFGTKSGPNFGGEICFDAAKLSLSYASAGINAEEEMIKLAALAFHEHVHHFQEDPIEQFAPRSKGFQDCVSELEAEAYALSAYVQSTAKVLQLPSLKWEPEQPESNEERAQFEICFRQIINPGRDQINACRQVKTINAAACVAHGRYQKPDEILACTQITNTYAGVCVQQMERLGTSNAEMIRTCSRIKTETQMNCIFQYYSPGKSDIETCTSIER